MKTCRSLILFIFLGLLSATSSCLAKEGKSQPPWYQVEILLFVRNADSAGRTEHWVADLAPPDWSGSIRPDRYGLTPKSQRQLGPAAYSLRRSSEQLEPLIHRSWRQPVTSPRRARSVFLQSRKRGSAGNPVIEGVIKTSVNRYLHVDLDFLLRQSAKAGLSEGYQADGEQAYRFKAHRRLRSGELHYIDHPLMGALIKITPYRKSQPEAETITPPAAGDSSTTGAGASASESSQPPPPQ